ncbi:hypothetical protein M405DRAFT_27232 [Rhizopogon salebrosus TDB-379]|nr:hypothetical protein M405DRAFT_27232 [Rhizopogon salebrosus TDB-379]
MFQNTPTTIPARICLPTAPAPEINNQCQRQRQRTPTSPKPMVSPYPLARTHASLSSKNTPPSTRNRRQRQHWPTPLSRTLRQHVCSSPTGLRTSICSSGTTSSTHHWRNLVIMLGITAFDVTFLQCRRTEAPSKPATSVADAVIAKAPEPPPSSLGPLFQLRYTSVPEPPPSSQATPA